MLLVKRLVLPLLTLIIVAGLLFSQLPSVFSDKPIRHELFIYKTQLNEIWISDCQMDILNKESMRYKYMKDGQMLFESSLN